MSMKRHLAREIDRTRKIFPHEGGKTLALTVLEEICRGLTPAMVRAGAEALDECALGLSRRGMVRLVFNAMIEEARRETP